MALSGTNYLPLPIETSSRGGIGVPVFIQDQTTGPLDLPFLQHINITTLTADASVDDETFYVPAGHGAIAGNTIELASTVNGSIFMQAIITSVTATSITAGTPSSHLFLSSSTTVIISNENMAVNGAVTPQIFSVTPLALQSGDMVRIIISITDDAVMDFESFGGGLALSKGLALRVNNGDGTYRNIYNFKTNGDIELYAYDARYFENKAGATRGFSARMTWGGQSKHGVVIRLDGALSEALELVVQDDLTSQISVRCLAQGSEVQD